MFDKTYSSPHARAEGFANRLGVRLPILQAPMAGACPPLLSIAVANAGGLGACGALMMFELPSNFHDISQGVRPVREFTARSSFPDLGLASLGPRAELHNLLGG